MNFHTRIAWGFMWRFILTFTLVGALYIGIIFYIAYQRDMTVKSPFSPRDLLVHVVEKTTVTDGKIQLDQKALEQVTQKQGWIQVLDAQGKEAHAFRKPADFPKQVSPGRLATYQRDELKTGYNLYTWWDEKNGKPYTWIMGIPHPEAKLLKEAMARMSIQGEKVMVPPDLLQKIDRQHTWMQVLDEWGREIYSYRRPQDQPTRYTPGMFISIKEYQTRFIYFTDHRNGREYTWMMGASGQQLGHDQELKRHDTVRLKRLQELAMWLTTGGWAAILITVALLFGRRMGSPVIHMMKWLQDLSQGNYREPVDRKGRPKSLDSDGKLRPSFRIYREVITALKRLTKTLKQNEEKRKQLEKTREEWMAGVSHDLKTPLSSVKGYAELMSEEKYEWNREELKRYARVILEKAAYMEQLIEDLNLTFRLKNDALPLHRTRTDIVELVRREVIEVLNNPRSATYDIRFESDIPKYFHALDPKWFRRALSNLLMNAVVHNPPGTRIEVKVGVETKRDQRNQTRARIVICDDGVGMDEETKSRLFERYYRGTHTTQKGEGSGLGMAIAHQLILAHGGQVEIESDPGKGTSLTIRL